MRIGQEYQADDLPGFLAYAPAWDEICAAESPGNALTEAFARLEQAHPGEETWFDALVFSPDQDTLWAEVVEKISNLSFLDDDLTARRRLKSRVYNGIRHEVWRGGDTFAIPPILPSLLVPLLAPGEDMAVFDPFCQDGTIVNEVARYARRDGMDGGVALYAQTPNDYTRLVTGLTLLAHNCPDVHIATGDPILTPGFAEGRSLAVFDRVVGTIPAGAMDWGSEALQPRDPYDRFIMYGVPPRTSRDYAYLVHAIASLARGGRLVAFVPTGVLDRSARTEKDIRARIITRDRVEGVIALPPRISPSRTVEYAVLVIAAGKTADRQEKTVFIDASGLFEQGGVIGQGILERDITTILDAYTAFSTVEGFSAVATIDEIAAQDFNLEVSRYVQPVRSDEQAEPFDLDAAIAELKTIRERKEDALNRFLESVTRLAHEQR
nr:N-6 DNA methylase [Methanofollis sp. W23]